MSVDVTTRRLVDPRAARRPRRHAPGHGRHRPRPRERHRPRPAPDRRHRPSARRRRLRGRRELRLHAQRRLLRRDGFSTRSRAATARQRSADVEIAIAPSAAGYGVTVGGAPAAAGKAGLVEGQGASWGAAVAPAPAGVSDEALGALPRPAVTAELGGAHALKPSSVRTARGWTAEPVAAGARTLHAKAGSDALRRGVRRDIAAAAGHRAGHRRRRHGRSSSARRSSRSSTTAARRRSPASTGARGASAPAIRRRSTRRRRTSPVARWSSAADLRPPRADAVRRAADGARPLLLGRREGPHLRPDRRRPARPPVRVRLRARADRRQAVLRRRRRPPLLRRPRHQRGVRGRLARHRPRARRERVRHRRPRLPRVPRAARRAHGVHRRDSRRPVLGVGAAEAADRPQPRHPPQRGRHGRRRVLDRQGAGQCYTDSAPAAAIPITGWPGTEALLGHGRGRDREADADGRPRPRRPRVLGLDDDGACTAATACDGWISHDTQAEALPMAYGAAYDGSCVRRPRRPGADLQPSIQPGTLPAPASAPAPRRARSTCATSAATARSAEPRGARWRSPTARPASSPPWPSASATPPPARCWRRRTSPAASSTSAASTRRPIPRSPWPRTRSARPATPPGRTRCRRASASPGRPTRGSCASRPRRRSRAPPRSRRSASRVDRRLAAKDEETLDLVRGTCPAMPAPTPTTNAGGTLGNTQQSSAADLVRACTSRGVVLEDVIPAGNRVKLLGVAEERFKGRRVDIVFAATGKVVARPKVGADGSFSATAPMPPRRLRFSNRARYQARVGGERSLNLKLMRRMLVTSVRTSAGKVTIAGKVVGPLALRAKDREIVLERRVTCTRLATVSRFRPRANGAFKVTVPVPAGTSAAVYRLRTKVRASTHGSRLSSTFTLPRAIGFRVDSRRRGRDPLRRPRVAPVRRGREGAPAQGHRVPARRHPSGRPQAGAVRAVRPPDRARARARRAQDRRLAGDRPGTGGRRAGAAAAAAGEEGAQVGGDRRGVGRRGAAADRPASDLAGAAAARLRRWRRTARTRGCRSPTS